MTKKSKIGWGIALAVILIFIFSFYGFIKRTYNTIVTYDENVKEKWSQVENVYQRRFDLIPNLVSTVKGYAAHEKETFTAVTKARAKAATRATTKGMFLSRFA